MSEGTSYLAQSFLDHRVYIYLEPVEQKPASNQTVLHLGMYVENDLGSTFTSGGSSYLGIGAYNGATARRHSFTAPSAPLGTTWLVRDVELTVTHAADGTAKAVPILWHWNINAGSFIPTSGTVYVDLETLDLVSRPTVSRFYCPVGETVTISTNRVRNSFRHTLSYSLGETGGSIAQDVGASFDWTIPEALLLAMPENSQDTCTVTCSTYNGSICLGSRTCVFVVQVGSAGKITVDEGWCSVSPDSENSAVKSWGIYVDGYSYASATVDQSKIHLSPGATLRDITMELAGKTYASPWVSAPVTGAYAQTAYMRITDSRGTSYTEGFTFTPVVYNTPSLWAAVCCRAGLDGEADDAGNYLWVACTPVFSPVAGFNSAKVSLGLYSAGGSLLDKEVVTGDGVYFGTLDAQYAYRAVLEIMDALGNTNSISYIIPPQAVTFQLKEGGDGAAFGGPATEADCLDIKWSKLRLGGETVADFPVETGTTGIWTWRKWHSGQAECWGTLTGSISTNRSVGSLYGTSTISTSLPFSFLTAPRCQVSANCTGGKSYWVGSGYGSGDTQRTPNYSLVTPTSGQIDYHLELYALGQWK